MDVLSFQQACEMEAYVGLGLGIVGDAILAWPLGI